MFKTFTAMFVLTLSVPSSAATGLVWNWDGDITRQYLISSTTVLIYPEVMQGEGTGELHFIEMETTVLTTCAATSVVGKKAYDVSCVIDDLGLRGTPQRGENIEKAVTVLETVAAAAKGARVVSRFGRDGRVTKIDLRDLDLSKSWMSINANTLQIVLGHAFGGLDLQLPKDGDDKGKGKWTQREAKPMSLAIEEFTLGMIKMEHTLASSGVDSTTIHTESHGTLTPGSESEGASAGLTYDATMTGNAIFDTSKGALVQRVFDVSGSLTAGSKGANGASRPYVHHLELKLEAAE